MSAHEIISQVQKETSWKGRPCGNCPYSAASYKHPACKYRNAEQRIGMQAQIGSGRTDVPCLYECQKRGVNGWIDPVTGEPHFITEDMIQAIETALENPPADA